MPPMFEIIARIEIPKQVKKAKNIFLNYPTHLLAVVLGAILIYVVYALILFQYLDFIPLNKTDAFDSILVFSILLACFLMIFSREKLKRKEYAFFFLNTSINAGQFVAGSYFLLYVFFNIFIFFAFLPLLISFYIKHIQIHIFHIFLVLLLLFIIFWFILFIWILSSLIVGKWLGRHKDGLYFKSLLFMSIIWGLHFVSKHMAERIGNFGFLFWIGCLVALLILWIGIKNLSGRYLFGLFQQSHTGNYPKKIKSKEFKLNHYVIHFVLEAIYYFRNRLFAEMALMFSILYALTIGVYIFSDAMTFAIVYSFIMNLGLKELMIVLPLCIGMHFRQYNLSIFMINAPASVYFFPRIFMAIAVNFMIYFLFVVLNCFILNQDFLPQLTGIFSIFFVTMLSTFAGFIVRIHDGNKAVALIIILVIVAIIDSFLHYFISQSYYIDFIYVAGGIFLYLISQNIFLRRPVFK